MKKKLSISIFLFLMIVIVKYSFSNYSIHYYINNHFIKTMSKRGRVYFEIDEKYNFDIYTKSRKKKIIDNIYELNIDNYACIVPSIKNINTYPLCYDSELGINIDFNLIDNDELNKYKNNQQIIDKTDKDFVFYNNLENKTSVALWTYKGYILMNNQGYKNVTIFNKDRYDNDLSHQIDNKIYMPNYDIEHEFNELIGFDIITGKINKINISTKIDYDSYVVGNINNKLYIYDNKNSKLYEINLKNSKTQVIASGEKGFIKYENGKFIECSKNEYKIDKIKFSDNNQTNYEYSIDNGTFKKYRDNNKIITKLFEDNVDILLDYKNKIYYKNKDSLYLYTPDTGSKKIFYDYELSFNNSKSIFIYID